MDDDRFIELMGLLSTFLSRTNYALETIAGAQTAMAEVEIQRHQIKPGDIPHARRIILRPAQCQEPCCQREA